MKGVSSMLFRNIRWYWHLSRLESMIKKNKNLEITKRYKYHKQKLDKITMSYDIAFRKDWESNKLSSFSKQHREELHNAKTTTRTRDFMQRRQKKEHRWTVIHQCSYASRFIFEMDHEVWDKARNSITHLLYIFNLLN